MSKSSHSSCGTLHWMVGTSYDTLGPVTFNLDPLQIGSPQNEFFRNIWTPPEKFVPTQGPACESLDMLASHSTKVPMFKKVHIRGVEIKISSGGNQFWGVHFCRDRPLHLHGVCADICEGISTSSSLQGHHSLGNYWCCQLGSWATHRMSIFSCHITAVSNYLHLKIRHLCIINTVGLVSSWMPLCTGSNHFRYSEKNTTQLTLE